MGFPFYFIAGVVFLVYSYVLYPLLIKAMLKRKRNVTTYQRTAVVPSLSIVIAAHNEEKVLREKLDSILNCAYPQQQIELLIGIDNSADFSAIIAKEYQHKFASCKVYEFEQRQGKFKL